MNNHEINIGGIVFKKIEDFWFSNLLFNGNEASFEIYQESFNENLVKESLSELNGKLLNINMIGLHLLIELSKVFWGHNNNAVFDFSGFVIDDTTDKRLIDFRMCYHCSGENNFSDLANWFIDVKDFRIVGCIRQQL